MSILKIENLYKIYGSLHAVDGLSLAIKEGICFGLLGPNGAGKSTTIEIIEGIKKPSSGEILYRGKPRGKEFQEKIGIQFQMTALQDFMTVEEALELFASMYSQTVPISQVIEECQLQGFLKQDHRKISGGQRQRLLLAIALLNDPEMIFLDEPTTGLDPYARANFWKLIQSIKQQGKTIILTTHYMEEAYTLCDEIAIVDRGKVITEGTPKELLKKHFKGMKVTFPSEVRAQFSKDFPWDLREHQGRVEFHTSDLRKSLQDLLREDIDLDHMEIQHQTLEDLFIQLTGEEK